MARQGRRPLSLFILVALILLLAAAAVVIIFSERRIEGSIPGDAAVLSLANVGGGFAVGTSNGMYVSDDGKGWQRFARTSVGPVAVTSGIAGPRGSFQNFTYAVSGKTVFWITGLDRSMRLANLPEAAGALSVLAPSGLLASTGGGTFYLVNAQLVSKVDSSGGPSEVLAVGLPQGVLGYVLAGGVGSGLWRSEGAFTSEGLNWSRILETPVSAIHVDPLSPNRVLLGTPGGILISTNKGDSWRFTEFRGSVAGLSSNGTEFFAVSDRLIYRSADGEKDWTALASR